MGDIGKNGVAAAVAVVKDFLRVAVDENNPEAAGVYLTKASREQGKLNPESMAGSKNEIGQAAQEGANVIVPVTTTQADGQSMQVPVVMTQEDGQWRLDLVATMDRLFGGSLDTVVKAMGDAMAQIGQAMGNAMKAAFEEPKKPE